VASGAGGGVSGLVEVRIDSRGNAPISSFAIGNTGGWRRPEISCGRPKGGAVRSAGAPVYRFAVARRRLRTFFSSQLPMVTAKNA
jgi:hypothetical protein